MNVTSKISLVSFISILSTLGLAACGAGVVTDGAYSATDSSGASSGAPAEVSSGVPAGVPAAAVDDSNSTSVALSMDDKDLMQSSLDHVSNVLSSIDAEAGMDEALNANAIVQGCVTITTNPAPLNPAKLPTTFSITWTFKNCKVAANVTESGTSSVTQTRDANALVSDTNNTVSVVLTDANNTKDAFTETSNLKSQGSAASGSVTRTAQASGSSTITSATGTVVDNQAFSDSLTIADTFKQTALSQRVVNGNEMVSDSAAKTSSAVAFKQLTFDPAKCCYPVSGTLSITDNATTQSYTFSATCGQVTGPNGTAMNLRPCK